MSTLSKLIEVQPFTYRVLDEQTSKRSGVLLTLEGIFQRAGVKNQNDRVYPEALWQKIMSDEEINERLANRRMLGELDHPANGSTSTHRVSHIVTEHSLEPDGTILGRLEVLDTPAGRIAETLIKAGVQLGISSRGDGSVQKKGDVSEVQDDYRLETYDLVLKPSTPGAYPQIVENQEAAVANNSLIADAVEGLVKSTTDVDVLLECHKIISVLEAGSRCAAILSEIKSKLTVAAEHFDQPKETTRMTTTTASPELSRESALLLKEHVDRGIAEAVQQKDSKISELNESLVQALKLKEEVAKRLEAAEKIIDEQQTQLKSLKESSASNTDLATRYDAAIKILDEAIPRLRTLGETQRRLSASNALLATSIGRHKQEAVNRKINSLIGDLDESVQSKLRPLLAECSTAREVSQRFKSLSELVKLSTHQPSRKEPLPTRESRTPVKPASTLTESTTARKHKDFITNRLMNRMSGV